MGPIVRPVLHDGLITLLPLEAKHEAEYTRLANEPTIAPRVNNPIPFTSSNFADLMQQLEKNAELQHHVWMIACDGQMCGGINTGDLRGVKIFQGGYWVEPAFRGKAIAKTALTLVRDYLFQSCGALRVQALVEPDNAPSIRVLKQCGYQHEGLLKKFYPSLTRGLIDVHMYAIVRE